MNESTKTEEVNEKIGKLRLIYQRLSGFKE